MRGLASASPAAVYAGQVAQAREAARVKAEAEDDGGALDDAWNWAGGAAEDVGNTVSGFTNELSFGVVDLGGDKDSGAYKTGQVGSYVPWNPVSALKSLGTGAFKLGVKKLGKEAVEEGAETTGKRNADDAARSATQGERLRDQLTAEQIAGGHAYGKHANEFPEIPSRVQFERHIEDVISHPTERRELLGGRKAWWREDSGTVVIRDPGSPDGGTAFRPRDGYNYFRGLR